MLFSFSMYSASDIGKDCCSRCVHWRRRSRALSALVERHAVHARRQCCSGSGVHREVALITAAHVRVRHASRNGCVRTMTFIATIVLPASRRRTMDRSYVRPYFR